MESAPYAKPESAMPVLRSPAGGFGAQRAPLVDVGFACTVAPAVRALAWE